MEDQQYDRSKVNIITKDGLLNHLDKKNRIIIILFIVFIIYLVSTTQLIDNKQQVCNIYINGTCDGNLVDLDNKAIRCCTDKLYYSTESNVPKSYISWTKGLILIVAFLIIIYLLLKDITDKKILNIEDAKNITARYIENNYTDSEYIIGPVCKLRHFMDFKEPFKWVIAVKLSNHNVWSYYQAEVSAVWKSVKPIDNFIGLKKRDIELRADIVDKEEVGDVIYVYDPQTSKEKRYQDAIKK